jgi:type IV secretion system protein VirD4
MLLTALRNPGWAILSILPSPVRTGKYVIGVGLVAFAIGVVLKSMAGGQATRLGFPPGTAIHTLFETLALVLVGVVVLRMLTGSMVQHFGDKQEDTHGSARFATPRETNSLVRTPDGLLIGRDIKTGKPLRYDGPAHLLTMAPTRTGKGVGTIIPNLLTANRSMICIDPKGENAKIAGRARNRFGPVHVIDPFGITGRPSAAFNPFAMLDPNSLDAAEEAASLAEALVYDPPGEAGEAHWNEEAKALIAGIVLYIASEEPPERRTLSTLREHLTTAPATFTALLARMQGTAAAGGLIARAANRHRGKDNREAAGVLSAAQRHTHFLDSPRMTAVLDRSDFAFEDLKSRPATVFLVLPPDRLGTYAVAAPDGHPELAGHGSHTRQAGPAGLSDRPAMQKFASRGFPTLRQRPYLSNLRISCVLAVQAASEPPSKDSPYHTVDTEPGCAQPGRDRGGTRPAAPGTLRDDGETASAPRTEHRAPRGVDIPAEHDVRRTVEFSGQPSPGPFSGAEEAKARAKSRKAAQTRPVRGWRR